MLQPRCPMPMRAYNIELLREEGRVGPDSHGWCFGLPPGISPKQWPLDPQTGYPLVHGFTLRLPDDYRCHGPDIAGLSFFAFLYRAQRWRHRPRRGHSGGDEQR
jgi:hypothetical protein